MSFNCPKSVKVSVLACSLYNELFHKKQVPHNHKKQVSEAEDDYYVCHMFWVSREFLQAAVADNTLTR
jgi:hypothetical protein